MARSRPPSKRPDSTVHKSAPDYGISITRDCLGLNEPLKANLDVLGIKRV
jgi:hypothetical protein